VESSTLGIQKQLHMYVNSQNGTLYEHTIIFLKANDYHNPYFLTFISKSMLCITICCGEF